MKGKTKVEIIIPIVDGQKRGDINWMNPKDAETYHKDGVVKILNYDKVMKKPINKKVTIVKKDASPIKNPKTEGKAINNIINRIKQFEPAFIEVFAGDDLKKDKPRNKIFDLNKTKISEIQEESEILNTGSYGVFLNINPLSQPKRLKANVSHIIWAFIDLDDGATEDHNNLIKTNLEKWGFTYSYNAKSGHGYHFLVPVDMESNQEQTIKKFLTYLKENICEKVDIATFTNERLMRFPESIHNKDGTGKQLVTLHTHNPTEEEIKNNTKLIFDYQQEQKKGERDLQYQQSIVKQDFFFTEMLNNKNNWFEVFKQLNEHDKKGEGKGANQILNKNLAIFASKDKANYELAKVFIDKWNNKYVTLERFEHFYKKVCGEKLANQKADNNQVNYYELLKWSREYNLTCFIPLLEEQLKCSFLDTYEIYYLEEEKKENSYLMYYPEKNYYVQKSLPEMLQNIYYESKERGIELSKELNLELLDDWEEFSFKKKLDLILKTIHKKLDEENRIKLVYNINYEPTNNKFVYFENKKYFNIYVPTEIWDINLKSKEYNFAHIKELIMNLCGNEEESYNYFIKWLAHIVQFPTIKLPSAIIFHGEQGTGKGIFKTHILDNIFGSNIQEINQTDLESSFNSYLMGKQIIVANEVMHNENRQTLPNVLKNLVTDPEITINRKFQKEIKGKNFTHWIFCTNSDNPIKIEEGDRRYSVFYSYKLKGGGKNAVKFVKKLQENLDFELKEFISYLKSVKVSFEDVHEPIMTQAKEEVIELNKDSTDRFLEFLSNFKELGDAYLKVFSHLNYYEVVQKGEGLFVPTENFYKLYESWCENTKERGIYSKQNFNRRLSVKGVKSIVKRQEGIVRVFAVDEIKKVVQNT